MDGDFIGRHVRAVFGVHPCFQPPGMRKYPTNGTEWKWKKGTIVMETPERPEGQCSALGLRAPKLEVVRVGFVGLGMRGPGAVERFTHIPGVQIVALCDLDAGRAEKCQELLKKASMPKASVYSGERGYEELCRRDDIDLVYVANRLAPPFPRGGLRA